MQSGRQIPQGRKRRNGDRIRPDRDRDRIGDHSGDHRSRHQAEDHVLDALDGAKIAPVSGFGRGPAFASPEKLPIAARHTRGRGQWGRSIFSPWCSALAVLIGCVNHIWAKLPPAIGMLLGSLAVGAPHRSRRSCAASARHAMVSRHPRRSRPAAFFSRRRAGAAVIRRQPARRRRGIKPAALGHSAARHGQRDPVDPHFRLRPVGAVGPRRRRAADMVFRARRAARPDRRGGGGKPVAPRRSAGELAGGNRRREPVQRRRRRRAVFAGAGGDAGRHLSPRQRPCDRGACREIVGGALFGVVAGWLAALLLRQINDGGLRCSFHWRWCSAATAW